MTPVGYQTADQGEQDSDQIKKRKKKRKSKSKTDETEYEDEIIPGEPKYWDPNCDIERLGSSESLWKARL